MRTGRAGRLAEFEIKTHLTGRGPSPFGWMHLSSGFLLLETVPGREGHVLDLVARVPGVTFKNVLFPAAIAVRIEAPMDHLAPIQQQLRTLEGVVSTRFYRAKNA